MRSSISGMLLVMIFSVQRALATDVGFQLETKQLASIDEPQLAEPMTVEFKDRAWAAPGLEEALGAHSGYCSTGWSIDERRSVVFKVPDPLWAHEELWPRTRELWGRGEYYRGIRLEYSPLALQR